jgi:uroporphyrinogen-III synthase
MKYEIWLILGSVYFALGFLKTAKVKFTDMKLSKRLHLQRESEVLVALTRSEGENESLKKLLHSMPCVEVPCISFVQQPAVKDVWRHIARSDWTVITSPHCARMVVNDRSDISNTKKVRFATVGNASAQPLLESGFVTAFQPTIATGEALAEQLPTTHGKAVFYPASALADDKVASILAHRGFEVCT